LIVPAVILQAGTAWAHVKWFVKEEGGQSAVHFSFSETTVQIWTVIILVCVSMALLLDRIIPEPPRQMREFAASRRVQILHLFQVLVGLALLVTAVQGAIIAPHLTEPGRGGLVLRFVEGGIGLLLIANQGVRLAASLLVLLFLVSTLLFGFVSSLEYFNFLGIALFLLVNSIPEGHRYQSLSPYALPLLRVHAGIALGVLAWTEKLVDPSLAIRFLEKNQVNFMQALGIESFTNRLFVLCAGCTELIFALIFALGLVTRINTLALAGFLVSSNLYFFLVGKTDEALLELTGHLPLFAIALILILYGAGDRLRLTNLVFRRQRPRNPGSAQPG
jgi:uncharacterized membrane protein YphA (DoxX/SURF4 family)